jgi:5-(carboxyamino)imidazole ribonucleotide synthase
MILPGGTLGMLGGGQLGRMFTLAARTMGYNVIVLDPDPDSPAGELATDHVCADYTDHIALAYIAKTCDAVSTEFENVPATTLEWLADKCVVRPGAKAVAISQDRILEKSFLRDQGIPTAKFAIVHSAADIDAALKITGTPAILKVARFGYDGKGQMRVNSVAEAHAALQSMNNEPCVFEQLLDLHCEVSVVIARSFDGTMSTYPVAENRHQHGILDISIVPARVPDTIQTRASTMAKVIAEKLEYIGVMAVEFFVLAGDTLVVNEIAPRPHNSGHYTLDACVTSQFEQQVRTLCGLPFGDTRLLSPVVMVNLLGDVWPPDHAPAWERVLSHPQIKLHLYGKREARKGRKMGHYNVLATSIDEAIQLAQRVQTNLSLPR